MSFVDWLVLAGTVTVIVAYGMWKTRHVASAESFLRGGYQESWPTIGLSIMATQASAITFLSTPGQGFEDGMRFVQFYFGLPLAMVFLSAVVVPIYYRLKVYTAYEYLETRFDRKTRQLAAFLFLVQRGLGAGITIYAPSIILSKMMGWSLNVTNVVMGALSVVYTVSGGTRAVSQTQKHQMVVMMGGLAAAFVYVVHSLPERVPFAHAVHIAGALGKMTVIDASFDPNSRYTLWSGLGGGLFLALSYFGTDQSQVQRYLSGRSITESRLGLLFNGLFKVPMQFFILFVGVMVAVFYQFERPPLFFNQAELERVRHTPQAAELSRLEAADADAFARKQGEIEALNLALGGADTAAIATAKQRVRAADAVSQGLRRETRALVARAVPGAETKDTDYVFISFVLRYLPRGLIGLLLAVIFCAAMSSNASEFSALGSTTVVDFYRRSFKPEASDAHYLAAAKVFTVLWGVVAVLFATFASLIDNLIQAVNIVGSLFYGTVLGIFLAGFFLKRLRGTPVFIAALLSETGVIALWVGTPIGFLWFNFIGCAATILLALALDGLLPGRGATGARGGPLSSPVRTGV